METHLALLRGVNVGGKHKLPMKELTGLFAAAGCADVRSFIQSGNVVFRAQPSLARRIPEQIADAIERRFGFRAPVVLRSGEELAAAIRGNPFPEAAAMPKALHLLFLEERPPASRVAALDPNRSPGDRFAVRGRDVYLHLTRGAADTRLTNAWFDAQLQTVSTGRNWNTVLKLAELAGV